MRVKFWLESLRERDRSEDLGVDGRIIQKWFLQRNSDGKCGLDSSDEG
jgi:hypothetical protein